MTGSSYKRKSGQREELWVWEQGDAKIRHDVEAQVRWEMEVRIAELAPPFSGSQIAAKPTRGTLLSISFPSHCPFDSLS